MKMIAALVISALVIGFLFACFSFKGFIWTALGIAGIFCSVVWAIMLVISVVYICEEIES